MSSTLDHYEVLETLGTGSFGTVSKIRRKADGKTLVWKEINFGPMSDKEKTQLVSEVNILRELRNPFVVKYHDRIVDKPRTRLYIIMEYCGGGDLGRLIKRSARDRKYIDEAFIWKVLAQAVVALKDCHRRSENGECKPILHRDIKPANILLDSEQNIKMGDFGLAKELASPGQLAKTNVGTPYYMAPEIMNDKHYDEKSDIWSLGCLLYEMAAHRPPFDAANAVGLAIKVNAGKYARIPSKYSDALADTIKMMLQLDPRRRPRVEDIETLSAIQSAMNSAKSVFQEFKNAQNALNKNKEPVPKGKDEQQLQKWEEQLKEKETQLQALESKLKAESDLLEARSRSLSRKEKELDEREKALTEQLTAIPSLVSNTTMMSLPSAPTNLPKTTVPVAIARPGSGGNNGGPIPPPAQPFRGAIPVPNTATATLACGRVPPPPPAAAFQIPLDEPCAVPTSTTTALPKNTTGGVKRVLGEVVGNTGSNKENAYSNIPTAPSGLQPSKPFKFQPTSATIAGKENCQAAGPMRRPLSAHNPNALYVPTSNGNSLESPLKKVRPNNYHQTDMAVVHNNGNAVQVDLDTLLRRNR